MTAYYQDEDNFKDRVRQIQEDIRSAVNDFKDREDDADIYLLAEDIMKEYGIRRNSIDGTYAYRGLVSDLRNAFDAEKDEFFGLKVRAYATITRPGIKQGLRRSTKVICSSLDDIQLARETFIMDCWTGIAADTKAVTDYETVLDRAELQLLGRI